MYAMTEEEYYTINQIAEKLQVHRDTVSKWIASEELEAYQVTQEYRISLSDFNQFMESRKKRRKNKKQK